MDGGEQDFVLLETVNTGEEAQIIGGFLESLGIPCQQESLLFRQEPVSLGLLGRVRLHVRRCDVARARRLLDEQRAVRASENGTDLDEIASDAHDRPV